MPNLHPNMNLEFDLDSTWDSPEVCQEIKRSCSFIVGSIGMGTHRADAVGDGAVESDDMPVVPENNLTLNISLHMPYWDVHDERSQANWSSFESWLDGKLRKVSNALVGINAVRGKKGDEPFPFSWLTLNMKGKAVVVVHLATDSSVDEGTVDMVANVRSLMGDRTWGEGVSRVVIPSRAYFSSQLAGALEAARVESEGRGDGLLDGGCADDDADITGTVNCGQTQTIEEGAADTPPVGGATESPSEGDVQCDCEEGKQRKTPHIPMPMFSIDYGIWDIEYSDGSVATYDSVSDVLSRE